MAVLSHQRVTADNTVKTQSAITFATGTSHVEIQNGSNSFTATFDGSSTPSGSLGFTFAANDTRTIPLEDAKNIQFTRVSGDADFEVICHGGRGI